MASHPKDKYDPELYEEDEDALIFAEAMETMEIDPSQKDWRTKDFPELPERSGKSSPKLKKAKAKKFSRKTVEPVGPLASLAHSKKGVPQKIMRKLKKGGFPIRDQVDLHGLTWKEAEKELSSFISEQLRDAQRCVLIIHGKAHGAVLGKATLKAMTYHFVKYHPHVMAAVSAQSKDGGLGALYVLLSPEPK